MKPTITDRLWRALGRFSPVREMIDLGLYNAVEKMPERVERWLWRRAPHAHHASQKSFNDHLHQCAYLRALEIELDEPTRNQRFATLDLLHQAGILPQPEHCQSRLTGLAAVGAWNAMFFIGRNGITSREASLALSVMLSYLTSEEDEKQALRWAREFQVDLGGREYFRQVDPIDGASPPPAVCPIELALHHGSNRMILGLLGEMDTVPPMALRGLVGRERTLSVEVAQKLERMQTQWSDALKDECPDDTAVERFSTLARSIPAAAGDLVELLLQARELNRVEDQHTAIEQATSAVSEGCAASQSRPRRRI